MKPSSSRALFVCACLCLLTFGIVFTMVGTVLLSVMERFGIDKTAGGALLLLMTFGVLLGALIFGPIVDRRGYKAMLLQFDRIHHCRARGVAFAPSIGWLRAAVFLSWIRRWDHQRRRERARIRHQR